MTVEYFCYLKTHNYGKQTLGFMYYTSLNAAKKKKKKVYCTAQENFRPEILRTVSNNLFVPTIKVST